MLLFNYLIRSFGRSWHSFPNLYLCNQTYSRDKTWYLYWEPVAFGWLYHPNQNIQCQKYFKSSELEFPSCIHSSWWWMAEFGRHLCRAAGPCSNRDSHSQFPRTMSRQHLSISSDGDSTTLWATCASAWSLSEWKSLLWCSDA